MSDHFDNPMAAHINPPRSTWRPKVPFVEAARNMVHALVSDQLRQVDPTLAIRIDNIHVVWFCKTLKNWKALVITALEDELYYEVTFNGEDNEVYIDTYQKVANDKVFQYQEEPE